MRADDEPTGDPRLDARKTPAMQNDRDARAVLSPAYQPGRTDIQTTLVLAAPGEHERAAWRPAAGPTGDALDVVLAMLQSIDPTSFPSASKLDYRIVNSVDVIMRKPRPLPTKRQIRQDANVARLRAQLSSEDTLVALGPCALVAIQAAGLTATFCAGHPGLQGINQLPVAASGTPPENRLARLDLYARLLLASRGRCDRAMLELKTLRKIEQARRKEKNRLPA